MTEHDRPRDLSTADLAARHHERRERREEDVRPRDPRAPDEMRPGEPSSGREDLPAEDEPAAVAEARERHAAEGESGVALFGDDERRELRERWDDIQTDFVDEPRRAVEDADHLVADAIQRLADSFARNRAELERQWSRGEDVSTEDLRQSLRRYRSFFQRLLSMESGGAG